MMNKYEALRDMGAFTEDMFNRVIAFQEREHPAWNSTMPFAQRIEGLPLHNLIFSNPDRDPEQFGPTVASYYPLREEMLKIAHYAKQVSEPAVVHDLFPGNGFIGSLLGREGIQVIGLQHPEIKPNQIESFLDPDCFRYSDTPLSEQQVEVALVSWPPSGINPSPRLRELETKLVIFIYTDHEEPNSGQRQTGTPDMIASLGEDYHGIDAWEVDRPKDLLHEIWPDMTPSIEELRKVRIYAHRSVGKLEPLKSLPPTQVYDWEKDLHMALLALQAKQEIQQRGFPV